MSTPEPEEIAALAKEVGKNVGLRVAAAVAEMPQKVCISGLSRAQGTKIVRARKYLLWLSVAGVTLSVLGCFWHYIGFALIAGAAVAISSSLCVLLFVEVLTPCGTHVEREFKDSEEYSRTYEFVPSIQRPQHLLTMLLAVFLCYIASFGSLHAWVYGLDSTAYSQSVFGVHALYFSTVVFSSVGFGDIVPISLAARVLVVAQIILAWIMSVIALGTLLPWVLAYALETRKADLDRHAEEVQLREELMRRAGLGLYGMDKVFDEARDALKEQSGSTDT